MFFHARRPIRLTDSGVNPVEGGLNRLVLRAIMGGSTLEAHR